MHSLFPFFLVRVGCVPVTRIGALRSDLLAETFREIIDLEAAMTARAAQLDEVLHALVPTIAEPSHRHAVLDVKRRVRSLRRLWEIRDESAVRLLPEDIATQVRQLLEQQQRRVALKRRAAEAFTPELRRLRQAFRHGARQRAFLKGVWLASPAMRARCARYLRASTERLQRRDVRLEDSLLGYYARAAVKTSPFSTFTATVLGCWRTGSVPDVVHLAPRHAATHARLSRVALGRVIEAIKTDPELRAFLQVRVNSSTLRIAQCYQFYRSRIDPQVTTGAWHFSDERIVRLPLSRTLDAVCSLVERRPDQTVSEVVTVCAGHTPGDGVGRYFDELFGLGLLTPMLPFSEFDQHYEDHLVAWLERAGTPRSQMLAHELSRALEAARERANDPRPRLAPLREVRRHLRRMEEALRLEHFADTSLYEDVMWCDPGLQVSEQIVTPCLDDLATFGRASSAFSPVHIEKQQFAAFFRARWRAGDTIDVLSVYQAYHEDRGGAEKQPLAPAAREIVAFQDTLKERIRAGIRHEPDRITIDASGAAALIAQRPAAVDLPDSASFFVQRAAGTHEPWCVNIPGPGYGRFFSRFANLDCPTCGAVNRLQDTLRREVRRFDDQRGRLADIGGVFGSNINLRPLYLSSVIQLPGDTLGPDAPQPVSLRDLVVFVDGDGQPRLRDRRTGENVRPCHCGFLVKPWLPKLAQFLLMFGPVNPHAIPWHELVWGNDEFRGRPRLYFGSLLLYRKQWRFVTQEVPLRASREPDEEFFVNFNLWRLSHGIPDEVFVTIDHQVVAPSDKPTSVRLQTFKRKPQYVDFTSPLFLHRVQRILSCAETCVTFEETYPPLGRQLLRRDGRPYASEFVVEVALR